MNEEEYKKELEAAGVEVVEEKPAEKEEAPKPEAPKAEEKPSEKEEEKPADPAPKAEEAPTPEEKERPKRSIYDDYKDKKLEAKTEKERADQAERERDELKTKLEAIEQAKTPEEKEDAKDDLEAFAEEINADPEKLKEMRSLFLKDIKPGSDISKEDIEEFKAFKKEHSQVIEKQKFDEELASVAPMLKELLPNASDEEMVAVKAKIDQLSHTKDYFDKELDYVIFKEKDTLSKLVSPKKRGLEAKGKKDVTEANFTFDPNADYSKMSFKERELHEAEYAKLTKADGLSTDANGRKILI
jgi:hypothetical protein